MIRLKTAEDLAKLRRGGVILSSVLGDLVRAVRPGVDAAELETLALKLFREAGGEPAFKGHHSHRPGVSPFPTALCFSLNSEIVHGAALPGRVARAGDLLKLDIGLRYQGCYTDMAVTVPVGQVSAAALKLARATCQALELALIKVRPGGWLADIGRTIDKQVTRLGYSTVKDLCGHGVGYGVHEDPSVPNYFDRHAEPLKLEPGLVIAIEPMVNAGTEDVRELDDGWTYVTADGKLSAHFEVTVAVTEQGMEILTPLPAVPGL